MPLVVLIAVVAALIVIAIAIAEVRVEVGVEVGEIHILLVIADVVLRLAPPDLLLRRTARQGLLRTRVLRQRD